MEIDDELASYFRPRAEALIAEASAAGIDVVIIDTGRTPKEQTEKIRTGVSWTSFSKPSLNTLSLRAKLSTYGPIIYLPIEALESHRPSMASNRSYRRSARP